MIMIRFLAILMATRVAHSVMWDCSMNRGWSGLAQLSQKNYQKKRPLPGYRFYTHKRHANSQANQCESTGEYIQFKETETFTKWIQNEELVCPGGHTDLLTEEKWFHPDYRNVRGIEQYIEWRRTTSIKCDLCENHSGVYNFAWRCTQCHWDCCIPCVVKARELREKLPVLQESLLQGLLRGFANEELPIFGDKAGWMEKDAKQKNIAPAMQARVEQMNFLEENVAQQKEVSSAAEARNEKAAEAMKKIKKVQKTKNFTHGGRIRVHGLSNAKQHNGKLGTIVSKQISSSGRWEVKLDKVKQHVNVKPVNLVALKMS